MRLVLLVGLPASGKSTWLAQHQLPALSSDTVRELLTGDATNQSVNRLVFRTLRWLARARAEAGADITYIDSTALTLWERRTWRQLARRHSWPIEAIFFDTPLEECRRRNSNRARRVPDDILTQMSHRLVPPSQTEGFLRVTTIVPALNSVQ
jgi:predicted kinase